MAKRTLILFLVGMVVAVSGEQRAPAPAPVTLDSFTGIYAGAHAVVRDTNGDGLADTIAARVIVPDTPSPDDVEAATNIAARVAYETTAATLPFVLRDSEVREPAGVGFPILVGRDNRFVKQLIERGQIDIRSLRPGQGLVRLVPSPLNGPAGLVVVGGDDAGTLAASVELAARFPRVWNMTGVTLDAVEQQVTRYLIGRGVHATSAKVVSVVVDAERRGIATIGVDATIPPADLARAASALVELDAAHRRGQEERVLDFAEAAATEVTLVTGPTARASTVVRRSGLNARTLTPPVEPDEYLPEPNAAGVIEPRLAPAKSFDLATAYSIEGWFGDAYQDLIPDRTDTSVIVGGGDDTLGAAHIAARLALESTGVSLPLTKRDDKVREPGNEPSPILVGRTNALVQQLVKIGKTRLDDLQAGEGAIHIVPKAFGNATATVVAGADPAGTSAAASYLARRVPALWATERGAPTYDDLVTDVTRLLSGSGGRQGRPYDVVLVTRRARSFVDAGRLAK